MKNAPAPGAKKDEKRLPQNIPQVRRPFFYKTSLNPWRTENCVAGFSAMASNRGGKPQIILRQYIMESIISKTVLQGSVLRACLKNAFGNDFSNTLWYHTAHKE